MTSASARSPRLRRLALLLCVAGLAAAVFGLRGERVDVARVERGELRQSVVASGRVRTPERIELASQISGRIVAVHVREGDTVRAGQPLLTLDAAELDAAVAQARAGLAQAESRLRQIGEAGLPLAEQGLRQAEAAAQQAERQFERVRELVARGFYSPAQLDDARRSRDVAASQRESARIQLANQRADGSEARLARHNRDQARAALALAEARLAYATLRTPAAGRVLTRLAEPGDSAQPGKVLLTLAPEGDTELTAQIDEKNLGLLAPGQTALVSADAYPGERFSARLSYIAPSIDAQRGSVEIRLAVPAPPSYLRHEMTVSIDLETARRAETLSLPCDCLRDATGDPWVLVVREGRTVRQPVRPGLRGGQRCEIREGLAAGEAVLPANAPTRENRRVTTVDRA